MPAWLSVKLRNSPTANSGTRAVTSARKATSSAMEATANAMMPFENANRSPRWASWRGRKPSEHESADRRGKSANAVFADRIRIDAVKNWST